MPKVTYAAVLEWLREQDEDETVQLTSYGDCLIARFLKAHGATAVGVRVDSYTYNGLPRQLIPEKLAKVVATLIMAQPGSGPGFMYGNLIKAMEVWL